MQVLGTAPALDKRTASIEPAGEAKLAIAAKSKVLVPWAQDKTKCGLEGTSQEGKLAHEQPPKVLPLEEEHEIKTP